MAQESRDSRNKQRSVNTSTTEDQPPATARRPVVLAVLLTSLIWLVVAGGVALAWRRPEPVAFQLQPPPATFTPIPTPTPAPLRVEVSGAVVRPGVYELPAGARVGDALAAAGGLAPYADAGVLNLAGGLQDGEKLTAPTVRPVQSAIIDANATPDLAARGQAIDLGTAGLLDINRATAQELEALPAIGPVTAQAILDYRVANGPFRSVDDLVQVKGIGPATMEKIRALITVGE